MTGALHAALPVMKGRIVILLIEDDPFLGPAMREILFSRGYQVSLATTVQEGFGLLTSAHCFQVVLLDLELGSERGETLIGLVRALNVKVPKIIIFSAQPVAELTRAARQVDAFAIMQKPCNAQVITDTIERVAA
jgi:DNA-binding NtrC family response regulator